MTSRLLLGALVLFCASSCTPLHKPVGSRHDGGSGGPEPIVGAGQPDASPDSGAVASGTDGGGALDGNSAGPDGGDSGMGYANMSGHRCDPTCADCVVGGVETCDGKDNDCDGMVDELPPEACGSMIGACTLGMRSCVKGKWSACAGGTAAVDEVCDGKLDEDCDGSVDEGCDCSTGTRMCGQTGGTCKQGTQTCESGSWSVCRDAVGPTAEVCDDKDNDCNGMVDDNLERSCGIDVGACQSGTSVCTAGAWGACTGEVTPTDETCNNVDDDCDGMIDDGLSMACGSAVGACRQGTQTCSAGSWGSCTGAVGPQTEICDANNVDENCDGTSNEGCACINGTAQNCGSNVGACTYGTQTCSNGAWGSCVGGTTPKTEVCDAAMVDENCDGNSNEGCACINNDVRSCGTNQGECTAGTETCVNGQWGACVGSIGPSTEICDGLDNNCDNSTDNGASCSGMGVRDKCIGGKCVQCGTGAACASGYGCNASTGLCEPLCGNGKIDSGEACDPTASGYTTFNCSDTCTVRHIFDICYQPLMQDTCDSGSTCGAFGNTNHQNPQNFCIPTSSTGTGGCPKITGYSWAMYGNYCVLPCTTSSQCPMPVTYCYPNPTGSAPLAWCVR